MQNRLPEDRWDAEAALGIRATPRNPTPSSDDGEIHAFLVVEDGVEADRRKTRQEVVEERAAQDLDSGAGLPRPDTSDPLEPGRPRRFMITDRVLLKYGFSSAVMAAKGTSRARRESTPMSAASASRSNGQG